MRYANLQKGLMVSELYQLPYEWEWKKISDTFKIKSGDFLPKKTMVESGSYNVYGGNGINGKHNEYNLSGENIIIGRVGALCGNIRFLKENIWLTDNAFYVSEYLNDIDKNYLSIFLSFINLGETANQAAQPVISYKGIANIDIPFPPLEEQKRIVSKLDNLFEKIDKSISLHQKNIDEANVFMASVLNEVFVELEEKYEIKTVDEVSLNVRYGYTDSAKDKGNAVFIRITDINENGKFKDNFVYVDIEDKELERFKLHKGDILVARSGATAGKVALYDLDFISVFASYLIRIQPNEKMDSSFFFYFCHSPNYWEQLNVIKVGGAQPNVNATNLKELKIATPPIQTQQKVVAYLDEISQKMEILKRVQNDKMESLKALKASILDKAFRGEL